jgi:integrase/recombinase XerD
MQEKNPMKINTLIAEYLRYLKALGRSPYTIRGARFVLADFVRFLEGEKITRIDQLSHEVMLEYQQEQAFRQSAKGSLLSLRTQEKRLSTAKGFTRFLKQHDYLVSDPGERIRLPKQPKLLPRVILSADEIKKLLDAPDMRTNNGYRNRIVLEILYDTAIRRLELAGVKIEHLDLVHGYVLIKNGKGDKDRVVPLSDRVCKLIRTYIIGVRPEYVFENDSGYLILNRWGGQMNPNGIWQIVKRCAVLAKIKKNVTTHTFRHTCATHMLKNGAPVRHLQEMLGHESLESTQIYTRVTINDLKKIHAKYHPSESLKDTPK